MRGQSMKSPYLLDFMGPLVTMCRIDHNAGCYPLLIPRRA